MFKLPEMPFDFPPFDFPSIDFSKLDANAIETVIREIGDTNIEIDDGRSQVRISLE